jgi:hypothetical protein
VPDEPGTFLGLPFTFESGHREGWAKTQSSKVDYTQIIVEDISEANTKAMSFPVDFITNQPESDAFANGARLGSANIESGRTLEEDQAVSSLEMDLYIEQGKLTTGAMCLTAVLIPDGEGYWNQWMSDNATFRIYPDTEGETIGNLIKYHLSLPVSDSGNWPFQSRIRDIQLIFYSPGSDYVGKVFYDNIDLIGQ